MWLSQLLWRTFAYASAYVRNFRDSGFDVADALARTRSQLGRFYWVNVILCSVVLYYYFRETQLLRKAETLNGASCYPSKSLSVLTFIILAEGASFILLLGSHAGASLLRADSAQNLPALSHDAAARRLHRIMWTWFPLVLGIAILISSTRFDAVITWCIELAPGDYRRIEHAARIVAATVWPGFLLAFTAVLLANFAFYRWTLNRRLAKTVATALVSSLIAIAVVGPADMVGIAALLRELSEYIEAMVKKLAGG